MTISGPFWGLGFPLLVWMEIVGEVVVCVVLFFTWAAQLGTSEADVRFRENPSGAKVNSIMAS